MSFHCARAPSRQHIAVGVVLLTLVAGVSSAMDGTSTATPPSANVATSFDELCAWITSRGGHIARGALRLASSGGAAPRASRAAAGPRRLTLTAAEALDVGVEVMWIPDSIVLGGPGASRASGEWSTPLATARALLDAKTLETRRREYAALLATLPTTPELGLVGAGVAEIARACPTGAVQLLAPLAQRVSHDLRTLTHASPAQRGSQEDLQERIADALWALKCAAAFAQRPVVPGAHLVEYADDAGVNVAMTYHKGTDDNDEGQMRTSGWTVRTTTAIPVGSTLRLPYTALFDFASTTIPRIPIADFAHTFGAVPVGGALPVVLELHLGADMSAAPYYCPTVRLSADGAVDDAWLVCMAVLTSPKYRQKYVAKPEAVRRAGSVKLSSSYRGLALRAAVAWLAEQRYSFVHAPGAEGSTCTDGSGEREDLASVSRAVLAAFDATRERIHAVLREIDAPIRAKCGELDPVAASDFRVFTGWIEAAGGRVNAKLCLQGAADVDVGRYITSAPGYTIREGEELAYIPSPLPITAANASHLSAYFAASGKLGTSLAVAHVFTSTRLTHRFKPWLDVMPAAPFGPTLLTSAERGCLMQTAGAHLHGAVTGSQGIIDTAGEHGFTHAVAHRAYAAVASRAVGDAYTLVPLYDMFNHAVAPTHDIAATADGGWVVAATRDVPGNTELATSYGMKSPEQFLYAYGFVEPQWEGVYHPTLPRARRVANAPPGSLPCGVTAPQAAAVLRNGTVTQTLIECAHAATLLGAPDDGDDGGDGDSAFIAFVTADAPTRRAAVQPHRMGVLRRLEREFAEHVAVVDALKHPSAACDVDMLRGSRFGPAVLAVRAAHAEAYGRGLAWVREQLRKEAVTAGDGGEL